MASIGCASNFQGRTLKYLWKWAWIFQLLMFCNIEIYFHFDNSIYLTLLDGKNNSTIYATINGQRTANHEFLRQWCRILEARWKGKRKSKFNEVSCICCILKNFSLDPTFWDSVIFSNLMFCSYEVVLTLDKAKHKFEGPIYYYVFNTLLFSLLVLHIYWWVLIYRMLVKQIQARGHVGDDVRSGKCSVICVYMKSKFVMNDQHISTEN